MKNHGGAAQDNAETLSEVLILCDSNSPNLILYTPTPIAQQEVQNRNINYMNPGYFTLAAIDLKP